MVRFLGNSFTIAGFITSFVSLCFFPYLTFHYSSVSFTGLQLMTMNLSETFSNASSFRDQLVFLLIISLLALAAALLNLNPRVNKIKELEQVCLFVVLSLTTLALCAETSSGLLVPLSGFGMPTHGPVIAHGSFSALGFWGFLGGETAVLIGSVIALLSKL